MLSTASLLKGKLSGRTLVVWAVLWLIVASPWLAAWLAFANLGGWPSNDDPFYAKPIELWSKQGRWNWVSQYGALTASSVAHVAVGALATIGHPFAYRPLFLAVIAQQSLGTLSLICLTRGCWGGGVAATLVAAALVTFPLYYGHAFTFMTDGPATAWAAIGCTAGLWGALHRDCRWLILSSLAIGWGYWIRQTDALVLAVPLLSLVFSQRLAGQPLLNLGSLRCTVCLLTPAGLAIAFLESGWWFSSTAVRAGDVAPTLGSGYWREVAIACYGWLLLCGWFALPWCVLLVREARRMAARMPVRAYRLCSISAIVVWMIGLAPWLSSAGGACLTNSTGTFIQNAHFGPVFLSDMDEPGRWGSLNGVQWPLWIWQLLSLLSLFSTGVLGWWGAWTIWNCRAMLSGVATGINGPKFAEQSPAKEAAIDARALAAGALACLVALLVAVLLIALLIDPHMDRYWLFLLPVLSSWWICLAAQCGWQWTRPALLWGVLWLSFHFSISIVFSHDMLAWNNARWTWVNQRLAAGLAAQHLDGGRDVNAWLRMNEDPNTSARTGDVSPWWSGYATEALAVGSRPGWRTIDRVTWHAWATGHDHELFVLAPEGSPPGEASSELPLIDQVQP